MRLSKLEIKGFKSFADRTVINFDENIIGIAGPNGCGKSNIVDAIRWVLGEQKSKILRSSKMENVIFNGSKSRKPANVAEVSISFDNTKHILPLDYTNVTITRRLYRDGESQYLINDTACRLKDITSLFLDTGIDSDSYAIIELSMVDDILEDRENARFRLFEHAAGINKYKKRKHETFIKLGHTEDDLERVNDLLYEIEANLKSLQQQARKAETYNKIKDKYKDLSISVAKFKLKDLNETYEKLSKEDQYEQDTAGKVIAQMKKYEAEIEEQRQLELDKEKGLSESQHTLNTVIELINELENDKKVGTERQSMLEENKTRLNAQVDQARISVYHFTEELEILTEDQVTASKLLEELKSTVEEKRTALDSIRNKSQDAKTDLDKANISMQNLVEEIHTSENLLTVNESQIQALREEIDSGSGRKDESQKTLHLLNDSLERVKGERINKQNELGSSLEEESNLQDQLRVHEHSIDELETEFNEVERELDVKENEYKISKNLYDNMEGYPESIKFLKKNAESIKQAPLLLDIINCRDDYRQAIESFLEPYLNHYVVERYEDAVQAVDLLASSSKGRANFLLLDSFLDVSLGSPPSMEDCVPALDIVEVAEKYKKLTAYLLGDVYILENENVDVERIIAKSQGKKHEIYVLNKKGKFSRSKHVLSGGSVGLFTGKKIGRVKNLESLQESIHELNLRKEGLVQLRTDLQQKIEQLLYHSKQDLISTLQEELEEMNKELISLEVRVDNQNLQIRLQEDQASNTNQKINDLSTDLEKYSPLSNKLRDQKASSENEVNEAHATYQDFNNKQDEIAERYNLSNEKFHVQQNTLSTIERESDYKNKNIADLEAQIQQNQETITETELGLNDTIQHLKDVEEQLFDKYEEKGLAEKRVNESETTYYALKGSIHEIEEQLRQERNKKDQSDQLQQAMKEKVHEIKLELNSLKERLSVEFSLDINDIMDEPSDEIVNEEELMEKLDKMKNRIENYGPINLMAIEAFEEIQERHDFIEKQKDDLAQAKESLLKTIKEIDDKAKVKFLETFEHSRQNFIQVFRTLFSEEDDCDLVLSDPNDPLESTIDIIAKPKGKKPLSISQLSGGEKTLTSVALLFALYLLKPAPFCIFDEVDAPLDDLNIEKFNKIIREFSKQSQFGVITHNKVTIAAVDVIYGVTMSEDGVSKVVPVDFRELKVNKAFEERASSN